MQFKCRPFLFALSALLALSCRCYADIATCHVVDPSGKPVSNVTVYLTDGNVNALVTKQTGGFSVDFGASRVQYALCTIVAPGYAPNGGPIQEGDNNFKLSLPISLTGKVVDTNGRIVVGAIIKAIGALTSYGQSNGQDMRCSDLQYDALKSRYSVVTDSSGYYKIDDLPSDGAIEIELADPKYVHVGQTTVPGVRVVTPFTAAPGAAVTGKVIRQDGKPIGTVYVNGAPDPQKPRMRISNKCSVASDGTYTLTGLGPGNYTITLVSPSGDRDSNDWVPPLPASGNAKLGVVNTAPDILLKPGAIVTGIFLDADTKKPVPGVYLNLRDSAPVSNSNPGPHSIMLTTGENGTFSAHVWSSEVTVSALTVPDDYESDLSDVKQTVNCVEGQTTVLEPLLLHKAPVVKGIVVDDSGSSIPSVHLQVQLADGNYDEAKIRPVKSGADGAFTIHQLKHGSYFLRCGSAWAVVSPKTFTVPLTAPLNLVLKRVPTTTLSGTVVDTNGTPVPGAELTFEVREMTAIGIGMRTWNRVNTDQYGKYSLFNVPTTLHTVSHISCTETGFAYRSGGDITSIDGRVSVTPTIMVRLNGRVTGTVYNGLGKSVAGAWVYSPDFGNAEFPIQAGRDGRFTLTGLAVGQVKIYAAKGAFSGVVTAQASAVPSTIAIHLTGVPAPILGPSNLTRATTMINEDFKYEVSKAQHDPGVMRGKAARIIACASPDAAVRFILSYSSINTRDLESIVSARLDADPGGTAEWALMPTRTISDDNGDVTERGVVAAEVGLAVAPYDKNAALAYYDIAAKNISLTNISGHSIVDAMDLTAFAYALDKPEADDDYVKVSAAIAADPNNMWLLDILSTLAKGNPKLAISMLETMPLQTCYEAGPRIVAELAKPNPSAAVSVYQFIESWKEAPLKEHAKDESLCAVLPILYKTDPNSALVQVRAMKQSDEVAQGLTILADLMPLASADPIYQEAENDARSTYYDESFTPACIAHHASLRDKVLGLNLYRTAFNKFNNAVLSSCSPDQEPPSADFAFYYAPIDPAFSRLVIERRFARDNTNKSRYQDFFPLTADCSAMVAVDINRASEMAKSITNSDGRYYALLCAAQYVLLTPEQRQHIPFDLWRNNARWTPDSEGN
jgi:hypothetical protein